MDLVGGEGIVNTSCNIGSVTALLRDNCLVKKQFSWSRKILMLSVDFKLAVVI